MTDEELALIGMPKSSQENILFTPEQWEKFREEMGESLREHAKKWAIARGQALIEARNTWLD